MNCWLRVESYLPGTTVLISTRNFRKSFPMVYSHIHILIRVLTHRKAEFSFLKEERTLCKLLEKTRSMGQPQIRSQRLPQLGESCQDSLQREHFPPRPLLRFRRPHREKSCWKYLQPLFDFCRK